MAASTMISLSSTTILQISGAVPIFLFQLLLLLLINNVDSHSSSSLHVLQLPLKNESNVVGFDMEIIHMTYSRKSPYYDPNATLLDRAIDLVRRSNLRAQYDWTARRDHTTQDQTTPVKNVYATLLAVIDIGTPPVRSFPLLDTGSNLMWVQCRPCNCFVHLPEVQVYDPVKSRSYTQIKCTDSHCRYDGVVHCSYSNKVNCAYLIAYVGKSRSAGDIGTETITFGDRTKVRDIVFGCGHENVGKYPKQISGLFGLGTGVNSALTQLQVNRLSFCFPRLDKKGSGLLRFGSSAIFSKNIIQMYPRKRYSYLLPLESIYVQGFGLIDFPPGLFVPREDGSGGIMLDSGTSITRLYQEAYTALVDAVAQSMGDKYRRVYEHPTDLELCYEAPSWKSLFQDVPDITFRFTGGGRLYLGEYGTFIKVDRNIWCLVVKQADTSMSYLGSFTMQGNVVGLDLAANQVSFTQARTSDCSKR